MDILRRNTDYAIRLLVALVNSNGDGAVPTKILAQRQSVSYQLACKLMQQLQKANLVESVMGPAGGFRLARQAGQIALLEIITAIQGPVSLNRCLLGDFDCPAGKNCPVRSKLAELQNYMEKYLAATTLAHISGKKQKHLIIKVQNDTERKKTKSHR